METFGHDQVLRSLRLRQASSKAAALDIRLVFVSSLTIGIDRSCFFFPLPGLLYGTRRLVRT